MIYTAEHGATGRGGDKGRGIAPGGVRGQEGGGFGGEGSMASVAGLAGDSAGGAAGAENGTGVISLNIIAHGGSSAHRMTATRNNPPTRYQPRRIALGGPPVPSVAKSPPPPSVKMARNVLRSSVAHSPRVGPQTSDPPPCVTEAREHSLFTTDLPHPHLDDAVQKQSSRSGPTLLSRR